ncbi:MAG TPA: hypothetical protein VHD87_16455 [Acidimicrobiales bacterium]|nr:hypothetical protein [Acidimicrobiales bacterium]
MRRAVGILLVAALVGGCGGGSSGKKSNTAAINAGDTGPLAPALLTQSQLRQVPGLSTAVVTSLKQTTFFADPDPRGPCGAKVPALSVKDAVGVAIKADGVRGAAQIVARLPEGTAKKILDARMADSTAGCPEFETVTHQGVHQRVLLVRIVRLHKEFEQALAVVNAIKIGKSVRAATQIDVRDGDVVSRIVIFTTAPIDNVTVRGIASLMGQNLHALDS